MFLIRADGNARVGAGHLMRCLTIADELRKFVDIREISFVCADLQSAELARGRGYGVYVLESDPRDMEAELPAWHQIPGIDKNTNVILVDSYFVTSRYLLGIREYGAVTLLDDMGEERFPVDRVINYNAFADRECYGKLYAHTDTELVLGSSYVPVRPQFLGKSYCVRERAGQILITTGGGDIDNIAGKILNEIEKHKITDEILNYHLVIGGFNPHFEQMKELERQSSHIHVYHNVQDMAGLMSRCDLAVTAGGSTIYELAAVGVPFVCFSYAANQEKLTEYLHREKIAFSAGAFHKDPAAVLDRIAGRVLELARDHRERSQCYLKEQRLTDGLGAQRLAGILAGIPGDGVKKQV